MDPSPNDWVIIDTNGKKGLLDFAELYKSETDKFGRMFADPILEDIADNIVKFNDIIVIDDKIFEYLINFVLSCKLKFLK